LCKLHYFDKQIKQSDIAQQATKLLLQAGLDIVIFGCGSLSASVVGRTNIGGLWLLSSTFISLFISGWGRTQ